MRKLEADGELVANQTVTVAGQEFFRHFVFAWRERDMAERYAIVIRERPSARWGTRIWVEFAQKRVFEAALPRARSAIKTLSEHAAETAYQKVIDAEVERLLFRGADVGPDEI